MHQDMRRELEGLTDIVLERNKAEQEKLIEILDTENAKRFKSLITNHIIPLIKEISMVIGRSGCSLNYYSNELAVIRDPNKRIFIQILFYPKGHSKITLGVNAPFLQFSFSPIKDNIKITAKISVKSDEPRTKIDEIEIDEFAQERIDMYLMTFLRDVMSKEA
ncbi:MAG: hypothetical protein IPG02_00770 [Ignavibacteria bacterium]|nr:hypothetical protein [Ignavibacteria bacterium]MBK9226483.1 hypothetical protein [Ignavibacteria bacterium]